jgi:hypothetical protein
LECAQNATPSTAWTLGTITLVKKTGTVARQTTVAIVSGHFRGGILTHSAFMMTQSYLRTSIASKICWDTDPAEATPNC